MGKSDSILWWKQKHYNGSYWFRQDKYPNYLVKKRNQQRFDNTILWGKKKNWYYEQSIINY